MCIVLLLVFDSCPYYKWWWWHFSAGHRVIIFFATVAKALGSPTSMDEIARIFFYLHLEWEENLEENGGCIHARRFSVAVRAIAESVQGVNTGMRLPHSRSYHATISVLVFVFFIIMVWSTVLTKDFVTALRTRTFFSDLSLSSSTSPCMRFIPVASLCTFIVTNISISWFESLI